MKLKLEDVRTAYGVVDMVQATPILDSSNFVRLHQAGKELTLSLTGTLWAEAKVKGDADGGKWICYADRRLLKPFLSTARGDHLTVDHKDGSLLLRAGQRMELAPHEEVGGYESWKPKASFALPEPVCASIKMLARYLPTLPGSEDTEAISFRNGYGMVATDKLFIAAVLEAEQGREFFLPGVLAGAVDGKGALGGDKTGTGIAFGAGFVYQPLASALDKFPLKLIKEMLAAALKAPVLVRVGVSDLRDVLETASQFLLDNAEAVQIVPSEGKLTVTVDMASGKFARSAKCSQVALKEAVHWPVRRLLPWLEYATALEKPELEYVWLGGQIHASAFRLSQGKTRHVLIFADIS